MQKRNKNLYCWCRIQTEIWLHVPYNKQQKSLVHQLLCVKEVGDFTSSFAAKNLCKMYMYVHHRQYPDLSNHENLIPVTTIWATTWQNQQHECAPSEDSDQPG